MNYAWVCRSFSGAPPLTPRAEASKREIGGRGHAHVVTVVDAVSRRVRGAEVEVEIHSNYLLIAYNPF